MALLFRDFDLLRSYEVGTRPTPPAQMDEYARAANDFCRVVESFDLARFDLERPSTNPNTVSPRAIHSREERRLS